MKLRKIILTVLICFIPFVLSGCESLYQIYSKDGVTYRLNKINGQVSKIENNDVIILDTKLQSQLLADAEEAKSLKTLNMVEFGKNELKASISIKWLNNIMYYRLDIYPYNKKLNQLNNSLVLDEICIIELLDKDNLPLIKIPVYGSSMSTQVDLKGNPTGLTTTGKELISLDDYKLITQFNLPSKYLYN